MKYLILCLFLLCGELLVCAQHMLSRQFPFFYQLSSNEIFDIYQDRTGYLWIGTTNGLARYDGYGLQTFRSDYKNLNLLSDNSIVCITDNDVYVWIATRKGVNLYNKQTCQVIPFPDERLRNRVIDYIVIDKNEISWIASGGKIYKCDSTAHVIREYELSSESGKSPTVNSIYVDSGGSVWVLSYAGLFKYDLHTDSFVGYPQLEKGNSFFTMFQDSSGNYWIGTWGEGLWQFFPDKAGEECYKRHHVLNPRSGETEPIFFSMTQDDTFGYLWLLSYGGLYALEYTGEGTLKQVDIHDLVDTQMMYTRIRKDREGNLWLASYDMAYTIFFDNSNIDNYPLRQFKEQTGWDANLLNLCLDGDNVLWMSQDRYGLCLYDLSRDAFADISKTGNLGEADILIKSCSKSGVWASIRGVTRLIRLTNQNLRVQVAEDVDLSELIKKQEMIKGLVEDGDGNLWITTWNNIYVKCPDVRNLINQDAALPLMSSLACDMQGRIWGISADKQVYRLHYADNKISYEQKGNLMLYFYEKEEVKKICVDEEGCLWVISSLGKIFKSDKDKQTLANMCLDDVIDDCSVLGLLSNKGNVWIITNKKILCYDIRRKIYTGYTTSDDNMLVDVFRYRAFSGDSQGGLYAGGHRGVTHIRSVGTSQESKAYSNPVITDVKVGDKSIFFPYTSEENTVENISLDPNDRNIEIFFSPLQYSLNARCRAAYKLEGVDKDWIVLNHDKYSAFYNQLKRGTYKFRLKLEYEQGKWTEDSVLLILEKKPAFYETWFAYFVYALLIGLCFYTVIRLYMRRIRLKSEVKLQEELTRTKLTYFTNVSHELLTPLTVISCISDYLDQKAPNMEQQAVMLRANVDKLKRLIQQVLDFRKMDVGKLKLNVSEGEINEFILNICRINFLPLALKKNITLETRIRAEEEFGYLDFDKLDKILHNLLSNAIKYTPENKRIIVEARTEVCEENHRMLLLKVEDEGIGIPAKEIEHVFTRFYSSRKNRGIESNGIGLSLTKDLVNLHHGTIMVESVQGQGTCFTVKLPIDKESYAADELVDETMVSSSAPDEQYSEDCAVLSDDTDKLTLLLIDDNTELLFMMKEIFKERFTVLTAVDGKNAWEKLNNNEVDVILCDVMLPDVNGWELCTRIKGDMRFNHIPVIILTAKNGIDDRVASYEAGADGYIAKPFELKILFARVDNLIRSSKMRQAAFRKEENINLEGLAYPSADKQFLQSIIDSIEQHLEESEFDLEHLSTEMNMSKSTLYRKIKSMTGMTPLDFVRNVKMKRACMMLLARTLNISEIAYAIGFSSPKYFTKCFKEEFGVTPTEYLQRQGETNS